MLIMILKTKKLTNVQNGDDNNDVMVKSQIEGFVNNKTQFLVGVNPGQVLNSKAVIYRPSGGIHSNGYYLKDSNGQEVHFHADNQDDNQTRLYVPNLKNNDSYGGRFKSSIVVTSVDQTIEGKKVFRNIEVPTATKDNNPVTKKHVDDIAVKSGKNITIKGHLDMDNNRIINLSNPTSGTNAVSLGYLISYANNRYVKISGGTMTRDLIYQKNHIQFEEILIKSSIILNAWIVRWDRYHNAKSALLEKDFNNSIEFFYDKDMTAYYTYFSTVPSHWSMKCMVEWLRIPQPISIEESENVPSKPEPNE